ncbi:MAG: helix-turn-helix transcriptional regulator [Selenomonadales bacterium]|nr:helix-turn-helix transcriptional regulator [Selenomonadales bacterium]
MKITARAARVNKGFNMEEAAKLLGITRKTLWNYEMGETSPTLDTVKKMVVLYGVPQEKLIFLPNDNT